jgi:hypothetical protein
VCVFVCFIYMHTPCAGIVSQPCLPGVCGAPADSPDTSYIGVTPVVVCMLAIAVCVCVCVMHASEAIPYTRQHFGFKHLRQMSSSCRWLGYKYGNESLIIIEMT